MTEQQHEVVKSEARINAWAWVLTAPIILLCLPATSLVLLLLLRLFLKDNASERFMFMLFYAPYLISAAFGPYILALAFALWLLQLGMRSRKVSVAISSIFLILALIGMLARDAAMK